MKNERIMSLNSTREKLNEEYRLLVMMRNKVMNTYSQQMTEISSKIHEIDEEIKILKTPFEMEGF